MKILIAADIFEPDIGGPATYSKKLATELVNRGFEVIVVCYSDKPYLDDNNFNVVRVLRSKIVLTRYISYFLAVKRFSRGCEVIYAQGPVSAGLPAMLAAKILRKKFVVKVVGDYAWEQARGTGMTEIGIDEFQKNSFGGKIGRLQKIERFVCRHASLVITPSKYLKSIVQGWGVNELKIKVIYNAVVLPVINKLKSDDYIILSIGRLVPWKGFSLLIDLMPELVQENPKFKLIILGDGPEKDKLLKQIKDLNLKDRVETKLVPAETVDEILSQASLFVLNTGYEGLSHTILQTFNAGVPVITTKIGGNPELVVDSQNGLLVEYNNKKQIKEAILKLYNNKDLADKFSANAKEKLKEFTFAKMINDTINIIK